MSIEVLRQRRARTPKHVIIDRNFVCDCGKWYMTRGALVNHHKLKHDGRKTSKESSEVLVNNYSLDKNYSNKCILTVTSRLKIAQFRETMKHHLKIIPQAYSPGDTNPVADFPHGAFNDNDSSNAFLDHIKRIDKVDKNDPGLREDKLSELIFETEELRNLDAMGVLALFCYYLAELVNKKFYRECVIILLDFGLVTESKHSEKTVSESIIPEIEARLVSKIRLRAWQLPEFANEYLMDSYVPLVSSSQVLKDPQQLGFFGLEDVHILRVFLLMYLFCKWLYVYRFTKLKLEKFK